MADRTTSVDAILRTALRQYVEDVLSDVLPTITAVSTPETGEAVNALPVVGIEWGTDPEVLWTDLSVVSIDPDTDQVEWQIQNEEVAMAFAFRTSNFSDTDICAREFLARSRTRAAKESLDGQFPLRIDITVDGTEYLAKLYLLGTRQKAEGDRALTRGEWVARVPGIVVYPQVWIEPSEEATGAMEVEIVINGVTYPIPEP